ncbi:MAG: ferritin family protein [Eubacteriales bacterium]|nr:ferritin family protein [Eubacteriales bacterium]
MQVQSAQEALFIACEMERGAVQLYERARALMSSLGREGEPLYQHLGYMLGDERKHLEQFTALYGGLDEALEQSLTLSAVASSVLFKGGLMGAARAGLLKDEQSMLAFAAEAEQTAAATYRAFAQQCGDAQAAMMLQGIAGEEDKHLETLHGYQKLLG